MRIFLQILLPLVLLGSASFANDFKEVFKISLKKDEQKKILVKYADKEKLFVFRWTLYVNDGLVTLYSYDKFVAQNMLYLNHKNQSLRIKLRDDGQNYYNPPYFLLKFKAFENNEAKFELYLYDPQMQIALKFLKNKN
ncbi:hypothetical protein [Sulfurimonas paralvinellae]|uniref:Uncharacterized protein n=1 Tax=Sulfurimonas paralvinellae TaxID=317658 RepID=A0A7M1B6W4_9BACT|nr:hypothetical protein [Sulfurimonas paralvinellae]QOP45453.1 hypothetical protein FM071_03830 [Sulfurimonas paralvinellae]